MAATQELLYFPSPGIEATSGRGEKIANHPNATSGIRRNPYNLHPLSFGLLIFAVTAVVIGALVGGIVSRVMNSELKNCSQMLNQSTPGPMTTAQADSPIYNPTASAGKYTCQCLTSSTSMDLNATTNICTAFSSSGEPCYPVTDPADFIFDCWQFAGSHGGICY
ncbi:hypothetical protein TWF694_007797 [Orbilia ellipsospora]|uniref:Uncharacterized protein n=1 Tax=Orbilia ellipsospora TaxID=2528407 RepID=A0AAV9XJ86_9PEZI